MSPKEQPALTTLSELALHDYGTGEYLPVRMPIFQPSGNPLEVYRAVAGFYCTGDSSAWILSAQQFQEFFEIQTAVQHLPLGFLQMLGLGKPIVSGGPPKDELLERIRARREAIQSREGILSDSYPLIREDREDR